MKMLAKQYRLNKTREIKRVLRYGNAYHTQFLSLRKLKNQNRPTRFSFIVGNKVAKKSTQRNKIKRRLREATRQMLKEVKQGYDCVLIARPSIISRNYREIRQAVRNLLEGSRLHP